MLITAKQIADWAATRDAQASLPGLIRRLVCRNATITQVAIPTGDSINTPGWDGEVVCKHGSPWMLRGGRVGSGALSRERRARQMKIMPSERIRLRKANVRSAYWLSSRLEGEIRRRNGSLKSRLQEIGPTFVPMMLMTLNILRSVRQWRTVRRRAWDHRTRRREHARHWEIWSQQSDPPISADAIFTDRDTAWDAFLADLPTRSIGLAPYLVRADSAEEAAAFVCAATLAEADLAGDSVVVTDHHGWRFVEANQSIKIAIAASPEFAKAPTRRKGLVTIIPYAVGYVMGGSAVHCPKPDLTLAQPRILEYEKALTTIGLDEADARRVAATTGRSWAVFRRRRNQSGNPKSGLAFRTPVGTPCGGLPPWHVVCRQR